eukprot:457033-Amphidinium_carterae.3
MDTVSTTEVRYWNNYAHISPGLGEMWGSKQYRTMPSAHSSEFQMPPDTCSAKLAFAASVGLLAAQGMLSQCTMA